MWVLSNLSFIFQGKRNTSIKRANRKIEFSNQERRNKSRGFENQSQVSYF